MKALLVFFIVLLCAGCASQSKHATRADPQAEGWLREAHEFDTADVYKEVAERVKKGDLRFKGWVRSAMDEIVFCPGVSEEQGAALAAKSSPKAEILYFGDLLPFVVLDATAYKKRNDALFAYMERFNRALLEKLAADGVLPNSAQPAPSQP